VKSIQTGNTGTKNCTSDISKLFNERDMIGRTSSLNNSPKYKHNFDREATRPAAIIRTHKSMRE
jgi:hypothetical protein